MGSILQNPLYIFIYRSMDFAPEQIDSIDREYETTEYDLFLLTIVLETKEDPRPFGIQAVDVIKVDDPCDIGSHIDLIYKDYESYL